MILLQVIINRSENSETCQNLEHDCNHAGMHRYSDIKLIFQKRSDIEVLFEARFQFIQSSVFTLLPIKMHSITRDKYQVFFYNKTCTVKHVLRAGVTFGTKKKWPYKTGDLSCLLYARKVSFCIHEAHIHILSVTSFWRDPILQQRNLVWNRRCWHRLIVTWSLPLVEQELLTLQKQLSSSSFLVGFCCLILSFPCSVL